MTKPKPITGSKIYKGSATKNPEKRGTKSQARKMLAIKNVYNDFAKVLLTPMSWISL